MTVELPVNRTKLMKYRFNKPRFRLKFPGLADKFNCVCCIYYIKDLTKSVEKNFNVH